MQITLKMLDDVKILAAMYTDYAGGSSLTEFWLNESIPIAIQRDAPNDSIEAFYMFNGIICCITACGYDIDARDLDGETLYNLIEYIKNPGNVNKHVHGTYMP